MRYLPDRLRLWLYQMEIPPEWIWCSISIWIRVAKLTLNNTVTLIRYCPDTNSAAKPFDLRQRPVGVSPKIQIEDSLPLPPYGILELSPLQQASHGEAHIAHQTSHLIEETF